MRLPIPGFFLLIMPFMLGISVVDAETVPRSWTVAEVSGAVDIRDAINNKLGTQVGSQLDAPFTVVTGGDGHAVVTHGQDRLTVGPDSQLTVPQPTPTESGVITRIRQKLGSVLYHDEHRIKDSFEVDTPYLVSVVKGTTFNIRVTTDDTTVALIEGSLFVHTPDMKSELMLKPGQAAIKSRLREGIILKDQQSLSAPRRGPITVAKDGDVPAANTTNDKSRSGALSSRDKTSEQSSVTSIDNIVNVDRLSANGDILPVTDLGSRVDGGNLLDLGTSVTRVSTNASINSGSLVDLGGSIGDVSTATSIGGSSVIDLGASVGNVSASSSIGGGSVVDLGATVGSVSASTSVGGSSVTDLSASVGNASVSTSIGGGGVVDLGASVGGISADVSVGGGSLIDLGSGVTGTSTTTNLGGATATVAPATPTTTTTTTTTTAATTSQIPILGPVINSVTLPGL